jgi:peptide/nickel transport system substrate-binding protein
MKRIRSTALISACLLGPLLANACGHRNSGGEAREATVVIAATGEPATLVPPLIYESVGRDISNLIYERLAELAPGASPLDTAAYRPKLAARWERLDTLTWRFHLRPGARWHDGRVVTAEDIRFSFEAFGDSVLDSPARAYLAGRLQVEIDDSMTVRVRFAEFSPEQLYDATYHVRIMPKHVWVQIPRDRWAADTSLDRLIGTGPYRLTEWKRGQYAILRTHLASIRGAGIDRVVWRFTADPDAAINLVLSGEADLLESVGGPTQAERFAGHGEVKLHSYPAAMYGFLAFRLADSTGRPHRILGSRAVRRALASALDRHLVAKALFGPQASAPLGPMSQLLWIRNDSIHVLPHDSAFAARALSAAGWERASDGGPRRRNGRTLKFDILVPSSSSVRRNAALMVQEAWRRLGVDVSVTSVDFPVFQERIRRGEFDAYIGAYLDEPSPRGLADQWTRQGWGVLNFGRYANPVFDSVFHKAGHTRDLASARRLYREAMDTLNADTPAVFLYAPDNVAAVAKRLRGVEIDPYSWLSRLPEWWVEHGGLVRAASAQ